MYLDVKHHNSPSIEYPCQFVLPVFEPHLLNGVGLACYGLHKREPILKKQSHKHVSVYTHHSHHMYVYIYTTATNKVFKVKELKDIKKQFFVKV